MRIAAELIGLALLVGIAIWSIHDYVHERRRVAKLRAATEARGRDMTNKGMDRAREIAKLRADLVRERDAALDDAAIAHCDCGWCSGETKADGRCGCAFCEHRRMNEEMDDR